jgi:hypothetical protein
MEAYKYSELKYDDFPRFITDYAKQEGILEEKQRTAKNLLGMDFLVSDISKITGLTPEQIQQLNTFAHNN